MWLDVNTLLALAHLISQQKVASSLSILVGGARSLDGLNSVVANGGAGLLYDLIDVVQQTSVSGVACSSIFSFTDNKPVKAKAFMEDNGVKIRPL